jgi:hypoxanthine phosphoribosyltransferase
MTDAAAVDADAVRAHSDVLFDRASVQRAVDALAGRLAPRYAGQNPLLLCVLTGGMPFTTWLAQRFPFRVEVDCVRVSRYGAGTAGGALSWSAMPRTPIAGRHVLVLDDVFDEGVTLAAILAHCRDAGAADAQAVVLVDKEIGRPRPPLLLDRALSAPDRYLYGCGMDYRGYWRQLPDIHAVRADYLARARG